MWRGLQRSHKVKEKRVAGKVRRREGKEQGLGRTNGAPATRVQWSPIPPSATRPILSLPVAPVAPDPSIPLDEALDEDGAVAKGGQRLGRRTFKVLLELARRAHDAHPAAATAKGRFENDGVPRTVAERLGLLQRRHSAGRARHRRHIGRRRYKKQNNEEQPDS